ncbi:MAG: hypothetical protein ABI867_23300 [Kofleriaceae bacterium]
MRSRLAAVPALLLVVIAIWEIVATRRDAHAVPDDAAWSRAEAIVRAGYQRGDLIVFAPGWTDPVGRLHLGDLIPLEMAARMDAARYGRIWELAIRDAHAPEVAGLAAARTSDGDVTVRFYERTPVTVVSDLVNLAGTAKSDGAMPRADLTEVAFEPHRCLLVPTPGTKPTRIVFPGVALGTALVGYVGIADVFTRRESREPVTLDVEIAGAKQTVTAPIDAWVPFRLATAARTADVAITLRWTGAGVKQICFAAEARQ